jgi:hypothetical protein
MKYDMVVAPSIILGVELLENSVVIALMGIAITLALVGVLVLLLMIAPQGQVIVK